LHLNHGAEVFSKRSVEVGDELNMLFKTVAYNPWVVSDFVGPNSNVPTVMLSAIDIPFALLEFTYKASLLLPNSGASLAAASGRVYDFSPVVANNGMLLNLSNAVVFTLLTVLTSVAVMVRPTPGA
jgi:hypothetical protein